MKIDLIGGVIATPKNIAVDIVSIKPNSPEKDAAITIMAKGLGCSSIQIHCGRIIYSFKEEDKGLQVRSFRNYLDLCKISYT